MDRYEERRSQAEGAAQGDVEGRETNARGQGRVLLQSIEKTHGLVQAAFEIARPKLIAGRAILLVDDVFTSGATASNCARVLKKNGATAVNIFTLARAVMN